MRFGALKLTAVILIMLLAGGIAPIIDRGFLASGEALKYAPDEFIVKFKTAANRMEISNFNAANEVSVLTIIEEIGCQVLKLPPTKTVSGMVALYNQNADVEWAEPNYILHIAAVPNREEEQIIDCGGDAENLGDGSQIDS